MKIKSLLGYLFVALLSVTVFTGCGDGGDKESTTPETNTSQEENVSDNNVSDNADENNNTNESNSSQEEVEENLTKIKGYLIDSPLHGVTYLCDGNEGLTNEEGMFECVNAPITFKVGNLTLGTLTAFTADGKVYPQDLLGLARDDNYSNNRLKLLARLLQSLDDDGDIETKITITQSVRDAITKEQEFKDLTANDVSSLLSGVGKSFVNECGAMKHLGDKSVNCNSDGSYYVYYEEPVVVTRKIGIGYYIDTAVEGIDYVCGIERGSTNKDGKFTFEESKECKFSLVGIPLRETSADKLTDGVIIFENNESVAKLLQSIDADGNLSNGIEINDEVSKALTDALADIDDDTTVLTDDTILKSVVAEVGSQVEGVSGEVKTDEQVQEHLTQTQTEITKELLAGKTFYVPYNENGIDTIEKHVINNDVTQSSWSQVYGQNNSGTGNLTVDGNKVTFHSDDDGGDHVIIIESMDSKYIYLTGEKKLYLNLEDAKKYFEEAASQLATLVGKTVYQYCTNDSEIFQMNFQDDGKVKMQDGNETEYVPYRIDGNTLYSTEDGEEEVHSLLEFTDTYVKFDDGNNETSTFYFSEADARANPQSDCGGGDYETSANGITSGKVVFKDENNNTISVPSDAHIRIVPQENQNNGSWNGLRCKIQSDGSFGDTECFTSENYDDMKTLFDNSNSFQVAVFKNHIDPNDSQWNCGEDVYKYVGDGDKSIWQNIEVTPSDYEDRSDESCNG